LKESATVGKTKTQLKKETASLQPEEAPVSVSHPKGKRVKPVSPNTEPLEPSGPTKRAPARARKEKPTAPATSTQPVESAVTRRGRKAKSIPPDQKAADHHIPETAVTVPVVSEPSDQPPFLAQPDSKLKTEPTVSPPSGKKGASRTGKKPSKTKTGRKAQASATILTLGGKQAKVQELLAKGKSQGKLTYLEIMEALQEVPLTPEQIDDIYQNLEELGIRVTDDHRGIAT
jgi:hypothetical protein